MGQATEGALSLWCIDRSAVRSYEVDGMQYMTIPLTMLHVGCGRG